MEVLKADIRRLIKAPPGVPPRKKNEEKNRMQILEAEDKALDREIAGRLTRHALVG